MGFTSENFDNYAGHIDFGEGEETLGILCHADVVPCGEGWICDPYNPQIIDGRLYGRGVLDNRRVTGCLSSRNAYIKRNECSAEKEGSSDYRNERGNELEMHGILLW